MMRAFARGERSDRGRPNGRPGPAAGAVVQAMEERVLCAAHAAGADPVADATGPAASTVAVRVNAGGGAYATAAGLRFEADGGFAGGRAEQAAAAYDVAGTADDPLFLSWRAGAEFAFARAVPDGNYALFLEFAEPVAGTAIGGRTFDAWAEGRQVLDDYDIVADIGGAGWAVAKSFDVRVADGQFDLTFRGVAGEAVVLAVVLIPTDVPDVAAHDDKRLMLPDATRQAFSSSNLRRIWFSLLGAADMNRGRLPANLEPTYPAAAGLSVLTHDVFASPRTGTALPRGELSPVERIAWVDARNDYVYVGAGRRTSEVGPNTVLVYENPDRVVGDVCVLFGDGHVETVGRAAAAQLIGFPPPPAEPSDPPPPLPPRPAPDPTVDQSRSNLTALSAAAFDYARTHSRSPFPATLGELYDSSLPPLDAARFVNPRTDTAPPPADWTREQKVAWVNASTDYVYLGGGQRQSTVDGYAVLAYENPAALSGGINVVTGDGSVVFREARWAAEALGLPQAAVAGGPYAVAAGGSVGLTADASAAGGRAVAVYEWDLDYDGRSFQVEATGPAATFSAAGLAAGSIRTVGVRVRDDAGRPSLVATGTVTVSAAPPPAVRSVVVNDGHAQRSMVTRLTVTFDQPVVADAGAFALAGRDGAGAGTVVTAANPVGDGRAWVLTFSGAPVAAGSLADGVYDLTVAGGRVRAGSSAGGAMSADHVFAFHRLFADADGDRDVDGQDSRGFRGALGSEAGLPAYNPVFDVDADGDVDGADSRAFRRRLGTEI